MEFLNNVDLQHLTTFKTSCLCDTYTIITSLEQAKDFVKENKNEAVLVLGGGSNILFTQDYHGVVVKNEIKGITVVKEDNQHIWVKVGAGEVWDELVSYCVQQGWAGIENLSLIPGTVGASPIQNIGAYGVEIKEVFEELTAVSLESGEEETFNYADCDFGYRWSVFKGKLKGKYIITDVTYRLNKTPNFKTSYGAIQQKLDEKGITELSIAAIREVVCEIRRSKLPNPDEIGNAGSFFKNPELPKSEFERLQNLHPNVPNYPVSETIIKVPAGWLIDQCGWKGKRFGNIGVYDKQALVLVNYGEKEGSKVKELAYQIKDSVWEKFQVTIEPEVNIL